MNRLKNLLVPETKPVLTVGLPQAGELPATLVLVNAFIVFRYQKKNKTLK